MEAFDGVMNVRYLSATLHAMHNNDEPHHHPQDVDDLLVMVVGGGCNLSMVDCILSTFINRSIVTT